MKDENNVNIENNIDNEKAFSLSSNQITVVTNTGYKLASVDLSKNFFENLLILEMELEDEFSMEKLFELTKQYSIAIEYYLQYDPKKAKAYQNRMEYLLTNKDTLMQLKRQTDKKNNINNDNDNENNKKDEKNPKKRINKKIKSELNSKKGEIKLRQDDINFEDLSLKVNKFLSSSYKKGENEKSGKNIINSDLEKQNENWRERLKTKKRNNTRFTIKPSNDGIRKRFQTLGISELSLSPLPSDINLNLNKKSETTEFTNTLREELYGNDEDEEDKKEENKIEEIKEDINEDIKIIEEPIQENLKIENNREEENKIEENDKHEIIKEDNINNEDIKEEKEKIEDEKGENKIIIEKPEEDPKEPKTEEENKDKNEIKEETKEESQAQEDSKQISLEIGIKSTIIDSSKKSNVENPQSQNQEQPQAHRKMSITEEMINIKPDEEISSSIESQISSLQNIISHLNQKIMSQNDIDNEEEEESEFSSSNNNLIKPENINNNINNIDKIPVKYLEIYKEIEKTIRTYLKDFNQNFYKEIFEQFSSGLRELYEQKYKKYIEIRNEYHNQIKENEYLLEIDDNLTKEKKEEIQQTIESLNEEQQHQIDVVEDEFNKKISDKIAEFKLNAFKHNSGIQLMEERVKFEIYSLINEAF